MEKLAESSPDVVLLDILMPELDGFGVLEGMKADLEAATSDADEIEAEFTRVAEVLPTAWTPSGSARAD